MSVFRVITRIIPLNSSESTFEPASFDQLIDGNVGEVKVLNLTEPKSGMKYRIERIEYTQKAGPGETVESINDAYAEKLKSIPGFVQLNAGDSAFNPYDKSFQLTLPKVLLGKGPGNSSNDSKQSSESFKISVVKNYKFKKANSKQKKKTAMLVTLDEPGMKEEVSVNKLKLPPKLLNESKALFKSKYPGYLSKKIRNSVWKKKSKSRKILKSSKYSKSKKLTNGFAPECNVNDQSKQNHSSPTLNYRKNSKDLDAVKKTLDIRIVNCQEDKSVENHNGSSKKRKLSLTDDEETDFTDNSLDSHCGGQLVINMPEAVSADASSKTVNKSELAELFGLNSPTGQNSSMGEDSLLGDSLSFEVPNQSESSPVSQVFKNNENSITICTKYVIGDNHPARDLLVALKKYFLNGECLICGFIPPEKEFNACEHMESHVLCNSFASSYKCSCCDDKFSDPRNLYMHALSREKIYNYVCSICTLKFKRRHYLLRHTTKSH